MFAILISVVKYIILIHSETDINFYKNLINKYRRLNTSIITESKIYIQHKNFLKLKKRTRK